MRSAELGAMALLLTACTVPDGLLDDRPCPCLEGWVCDATRNVCVEGDLPPVDAGRDEDGGALADGGPGDAAAADASAMDAGPPEPPPAVDTTCWLRAETCDWTGDFELVPGDPAVIGFATLSRNPAFSPDGCELYSTRSAGAFVASRENAGDAFGPSAEVSGLEGTGAGKASITPDGRELYFGRSGVDMYEIWRATRVPPATEWTGLEVVPELTRSDADDFDGTLAPHGLRFYWAPSATGDQDVWMAERSALGAPFGEAGPVMAFSGAGRQSEPAVTADERLAVLLVGDSLSYTTRDHWRAPWGPLLLVPGAPLVDAAEAESTVSPDGCEVIVRLDDEVTYLVHEAR